MAVVCTALEYVPIGPSSSQVPKMYSVPRKQQCIAGPSGSPSEVKSKNVFCTCPSRVRPLSGNTGETNLEGGHAYLKLSPLEAGRKHMLFSHLQTE